MHARCLFLGGIAAVVEEGMFVFMIATVAETDPELAEE
jgi:hypothetical protein